MDPSSEYIAARRVLLDALEALGPQRDAVTVVGAQAVYLRTGDSGIRGVAPYTTDADLALSPVSLVDEPHLEKLMTDAGFEQRGDPGTWWKAVYVDGTATEVEVDLMVPDRFAPAGGRRSVRIPPHGKMSARKALGLEGSMVDRDLMTVDALEASDPRTYIVNVAGPAALVVAKVYKLRDRLADKRVDRIADKDASDVYRLMLSVPIDDFMARFRELLADKTTEPIARGAVEGLGELFGASRARGVQMAIEALRLAVPPERVAAVCTNFVGAVKAALT